MYTFSQLVHYAYTRCEEIDAVLQDAGYRNTNEEPWGKSADGCVVGI